MTKLICPECSAENDSSAEHCCECGASLTLENLIESSKGEETDGDALNRVSTAETDLPGLLHALKQDGDVTDEHDGSEPSPADDASLPDSEDKEEDRMLPDWLNRIRQRASEEADSAGEIIQKLSAAQENLAKEKRESHHEDFASWIQNVRDEASSSPSENQPIDESEPEVNLKKPVETPEWLNKIRKISGSAHDDLKKESSSYDLGGDSLLQWLMDLEDGKETPEEIPKPSLDDMDYEYEGGEESTPSEHEFDGGVTQEMRIVKKVVPGLIVTREEQAQADQLEATIVDEGASRPLRKPGKRTSSWVMRLFFALLLIGSVSFALFVGDPPQLQERALKDQNQDLLTWASEISPSESLLLIFDYQAGYAQEIMLIATPVLESLVNKEIKITILSSAVTGKLLAQRLLSALEMDETAIFDDLGYFPAATYGAYGLANRDQGTWPLVDLPEPAQKLQAKGFDGILILSDSDESARSWVEQLSALTPETPINLLLTAQAGPLLLPYWESGQVTGMISGISEAAAIEAAGGKETSLPSRWRAHQTGIVMLMIVMLIGAFFVVERTPSDEGRKAS
ncbi:MAG: zinc ribbon domain-containing protein [Chloroflexota bacterium]|nr:zinc ribbon domain-containing protein [Chloroflexota bacterium]